MSSDHSPVTEKPGHAIDNIIEGPELAVADAVVGKASSSDSSETDDREGRKMTMEDREAKLAQLRKKLVSNSPTFSSFFPFLKKRSEFFRSLPLEPTEKV